MSEEQDTKYAITRGELMELMGMIGLPPYHGHEEESGPWECAPIAQFLIAVTDNFLENREIVFDTEVSRMIDKKFGITKDGRLIKVETLEEIPEDEPTILYRGRDRLALPMLEFYLKLCQDDGATDYQLRSMKEMIGRFRRYAETHPTKQPGITQGKVWDGTPS